MKRALLLSVVGVVLSASPAQARYLHRVEAQTAAERHTANEIAGSHVAWCRRLSPTGFRCRITLTGDTLGDGIPTDAQWDLWISARKRHTIHITSIFA
jgi:hypothetical protein